MHGTPVSVGSLPTVKEENQDEAQLSRDQYDIQLQMQMAAVAGIGPQMPPSSTSVRFLFLIEIEPHEAADSVYLLVQHRKMGDEER